MATFQFATKRSIRREVAQTPDHGLSGTDFSIFPAASIAVLNVIICIIIIIIVNLLDVTKARIPLVAEQIRAREHPEYYVQEAGGCGAVLVAHRMYMGGAFAVTLAASCSPHHGPATVQSIPGASSCLTNHEEECARSRSLAGAEFEQ